MSKKVKQHKSIVPGNGLAVNVVGTQKEDVGFALKIWKRKIKSAGIIETISSNKEFIKPSVTKRAQQIRAKYIQQIRTNNEKN